MTLDRTTPPPSKPIDKFHFPWPQVHEVKKGLPLWALSAGSQPILKLELVLEAGSRYEPHTGVAYFTAKMLLEGTQHKHAQAIATYIDQYGASIEVHVQPDTCTFTLITLSKHLEPMLALLVELLLTPTFPEHRLAHLKHLSTQKLRVEAEKNDRVARKKFKEVLFDHTHPYGRQLTEAAIAAITPTQIVQYYQKQLLLGGQLLVSGQVCERDVDMIKQYFQSLSVQPASAMAPTWPKQTPTRVHLPKAQSLQAAINMGKVLFTKDHSDYVPLLVVNTLLGGYFGSRLMRNLREEKGYTYGIFSRIVPLRHSSYLLIATEVIQEFGQATCQEIVKEVELLQTTLVPEAELETLRHYMLGAFLSEVNDPFSIMEQFKAVHLHGMEQTYYAQLYDTITHITALQVRELAQKHLSVDSLSQVMVGGA
ncbi:MAG: pitrilysin family protein [Roseivirga sp.]